jgi:hypothetical protein
VITVVSRNAGITLDEFLRKNQHQVFVDKSFNGFVALSTTTFNRLDWSMATCMVVTFSWTIRITI